MKNRERGRNKEISEPDGHHAHQNGGPANESKSQNNRENEANSNHFVSKISVTMGPNKSQNSVASKEGSIRDVSTETPPERCQICSATDRVLIGCCCCGGDFCTECVGMSDEMVLQYASGPMGLKWYCDKCMPAIHEAVKLHLSGELAVGQQSSIAKLSEQMAEMQARMINVEQAIAPNINHPINQDFPTLNQAQYRDAVAGHNQTNISTNTTPQQAHPLAATNKPTTIPTKKQKQNLRTNKSQLKIKSDEAEKLRRKNNIIVHNLPESAQAKRCDAEREDIDRVSLMIYEAMRIDDIMVVKATRLGGKRRDGKPRLLLCRLDADRDRVLRKARYVRLYEEWEDIFIDPDRTNQEQREHLLKREEQKRQKDHDSAISDGTFYSATDETVDLTESQEELTRTSASQSNLTGRGGAESQLEDAMPTPGGTESQSEDGPKPGETVTQSEYQAKNDSKPESARGETDTQSEARVETLENLEKVTYRVRLI